MQIIVINCGYDAIATEFMRQVETLGRTCLLLECEEWLQSDQCGPSVLLVGPDSYPREIVMAHLRDCANPPALVVLSRSCGDWGDAVAVGCSDFVAWPCPPQELELRLQRVMGDGNNPPEASGDTLLPDMLGRSPEFTRALTLLRKMSGSDATVLIGGETGTGKEMAARALHYLSRRRHHPFIPVNCGALPDELIENELFGHRRGAYTGAHDSQPGLVEQAAGGTLFLDEIGTLSLKAQSSLLRFLQNQEFKRLGDDRVQQADIRVISATNVALEEQVACSEFRSDLLYRLNILSLKLPPLRERTGDILLLAGAFLERLQSRYGGPRRYFSARALEWLKHYRWPGNIREMENLIHREFLLTEGCALEFDVPTGDASSDVTDQQTGGASFRLAKASAIEHFERQYLEALMARSGGNVSLAARLAGKERRSIGRLLKKHGITKQASR
jgi:DNA-binding NtrC family response regulator